MAKFLITGITGFAGPHLANLLYKEGHEVHGLIRNSNGREQDIRDVVDDDSYNNNANTHLQSCYHRSIPPNRRRQPSSKSPKAEVL